jgi:cob(I)alamin adenosyltransferase
VEAYGTVDELNSIIGVLLTYEVPEDIRRCLIQVQHRLFDLGGELCIPGHQTMNDEDVGALELILDRLNDKLAPLKEFILPGGSAAAAVCHVARTVCRRAERRVVSLAQAEAVAAPALRYLNRLSDLLFVLARVLNQRAGAPDVLWERDRNQTPD